MSRIGRKPIAIPSGVKVELKDQNIKITGPVGSMQFSCHPHIKLKIDTAAGIIVVENEHPENTEYKELHGTMRSLISNIITGVTKGFEKKMEIFGTGFNVKEQSGKLVLQIGFSHAVELAIPKGVKVNIEVPATRGDDVPAKFAIFGTDKCVVGEFAAVIRKVRPPEPYKGKGIRYADEHVKRKVGKAFASGAA
jgi:large subunit ribosomal protein L6